MADQKLSALTELAATPADDDEVYIRDVSEAAADESKRIRVDNLIAGAGGTVDFFDKLRDFIPWVSLDGFTVGGDTGATQEVGTARLQMATGATTNYDTYIKSTSWFNLLDTGKLVIVEFPLVHTTADWNDLNLWIRLAQTGADPPSETIDHFGWKLIGDATTVHLWASNADGTTQTITDTTVDITSGLQRTRLKMTYNPGTDIKFYVNDVLKVTHDTNLPDYAHYLFNIHLRTLEDADKWVNIGRVLLEKEHA